MRKSVFPRRRLTLHEYLAWEETASTKHEFVAGEVYAMTGVTVRHNVITLNLVSRLRGPSRARRCTVLATDVKQHVGDRVYYPDLMVACGKAAEVELIVSAPSLVAEVTSPSTRATDRREKLDAYLKLPSLRQYLVVDQRRKHVVWYTRADEVSEWLRDEIEGDGEISIPVLDTRVAMADIYEDVKLLPLTVNEEQDEYSDDEWEEDDES
jgi:Uma2 family endonuclease